MQMHSPFDGLSRFPRENHNIRERIERGTDPGLPIEHQILLITTPDEYHGGQEGGFMV